MQAAARTQVDCNVWSRLGQAMTILSAVVFFLAVLPSSARAESAFESEWTVLTVSAGGAWGVSTARAQGEAIAGALRQCQLKAGKTNDCGAELVSYKTGWSAALLCGSHRILASADSLDEVKSIVHRRLRELGASHELPPCRQLVTVDPVGGVTTAKLSVAQH